MKRSVLPLCACPGRRESPCGGALVLRESVALPELADGADPDELREGTLACVKCRVEYPVLSGVAILAPDPDGYVRRYHDALVRDIKRHGTLSDAARRWLSKRARSSVKKDDYGADFRFSQQFEAPHYVAGAMTTDPDALYGKFAAWLESIHDESPYDVLGAWAANRVRLRRLALDAGCGGGGLVARLAQSYQTVLGVDWSFLAILLGRRAVLHRPEAEREYVLRTHGTAGVRRALRIPRADNAELVVGDCAALPFPSGLFDAVCSCNVIDIAGMDRTLDAAATALSPGGALLLSDPFYFREGEAPEGEPVAAVRAALTARGLQIEAEADGVPWAWATYDRHWRLYFNYCVAARK